MKFCSQCGAELQDDAAFCGQCGTAFGEAPAAEAPVAETPVTEAPVTETPATEAPVAPAKKPALSKKLIAIIAGGLAVVILLIVLLACLGGSGDPEYGMYYKEGEVYIVDFESEDPILLTDDLGAWDEDVLSAIVMTPDGKYVFYPDDVEYGAASVTIYYRDTLDAEADSVKMAAKVTRYFVADDSNTVLYTTEKGELCRYSISDQESETISKNVKNFDCSEDGKNIFYRTETTKKDELVTKNFRVMNGNIEEPVELPKMYEYSYDYSDDLTVFLYEEEHKADDSADKKYKTYMIDAEGNETVIDTDVANTWIMDDGTVYYVKEGKSHKLSKFIKNDTNTVTDLSMLDEYELSFYELYKFDGEATLIASDIQDIYCESYEKGVFYYSVVDTESKIKLSEIMENVSYMNDAYWYVEENLASGYAIAVGGETSKIDCEDIYRLRFSEEFDRICIISEWDEEERCGVLYVADLTGATVSELEKVAEDAEQAQFVNGDLFYIADDDLYIEGEKKAIAKDSQGAAYAEALDAVLVVYDVNESTGYAALGIYKGGEITEIYDECTDMGMLENGTLLYCDEDNTWFYYKDGEGIEIDDGIIFRPLSSGGSGYLDFPSNNYNDDYYYGDDYYYPDEYYYN